MASKLHEIVLPDHEMIELYPINDVHTGAPECDYLGVKRAIAAIGSRPNRYIVLVGDIINNAIKSSVSDVYSEVMSPGKQVEAAVKLLMPVKDKILAMVSGNHEQRTKKDVDINPAELIAAKLGIERYSNDELFVKFVFGKGPNGKRIAYSAVLHHGAGGGSRPGAPINKAESYLMNFENADMLIVGHSHRKAAYKYNTRILDVNNGLVREAERLVVISGAWLDFAGYAARFQLTPGARGSTPILMSGTDKNFVAMV